MESKWKLLYCNRVYIYGLYRDNGKEHGNYHVLIGYILGLYRDNGKEIENC